MSVERIKLAQFPHDLSNGRWYIWSRAIEDFLWPDKSRKFANRKTISHDAYRAWQSDMAFRLGLFPTGGDYFEKYPTPVSFIAKTAERIGSDALKIGADLGELWKERWEKMAVPRPSSPILPTPSDWLPAKKESSNGLRFSLLVLILRYAVRDGSEPVDGKHRLVHWNDAMEAASMLLALSVLIKLHPELEWGDDPLPWEEVKEIAAAKFSSISQNPGDLKHHAPFGDGNFGCGIMMVVGSSLCNYRTCGPFSIPVFVSRFGRLLSCLTKN